MALKPDVPLDRDIFLRKLVRNLSGTLEQVVGLKEASGFVGLVGQQLAEWIDAMYREKLGPGRFSRDRLAEVLVDLKGQINGDFHVISLDEEKLVLGNRACPFGADVKDRPSLCMMTSNVFGTLTAEHLGYAKVALHETIARGNAGCRVVVYWKSSAAAEADEGSEYFRS